MFHPLATRILGAENKQKKNLEPGTRVIQSLNTFLHFLPATATEDCVAFARNPTSSLVHTNAVLWLLCFIAGAFVFPVFCLFARFYAQCLFVFLSFECIGGSVSVQCICWSGIYTSASFTACVWTKAIPHMMPRRWLSNQKFRRFCVDTASVSSKDGL